MGAALHRVIHSPAETLIGGLSLKSQIGRVARRTMYLLLMNPVLRVIEPLQAKKLFLTHLAEVDTSSGPVTTEIIKFHLVPDMRKRFNKFVKEHGCTYVFQSLPFSLS